MPESIYALVYARKGFQLEANLYLMPKILTLDDFLTICVRQIRQNCMHVAVALK